MSAWLAKIKRIDKYGFGLFTSLKLLFVMFGLTAFAFALHLQDFAVLVAVVMISIAVIELPVVNTVRKKDLLYLFITVSISALYVVMALSTAMPLVVGVMLLVMLVFAILYKYQFNKFYFMLLCGCFLLVIFCFAKLLPTNNTLILNDALSLIEFITLGFWLHKIFPNQYYKRWLNNYNYALSNLVLALQQREYLRVLTFRQTLNDLHTNVQLLDNNSINYELANELNINLINYSFFVINLLSSSDDELACDISDDLSKLNIAISEQKLLEIELTLDNEFHKKYFNEMVLNWNKLCKQMFYK